MAFHDIPHLSSRLVRLVDFFLWGMRETIILGMFVFFPLWVISVFFFFSPSVGALSGESSDGIRWASPF